MPRAFSPATAEQVVAAVEAVVVSGKPTSAEFVADFSDLPRDQATLALELAEDLGLLASSSGHHSVGNPLCRFLVTPNEMQKAAVLRVLLESYEPFVVFRERLVATSLAATAAQQTKVTLDLDAHRESIKDTLVSLGTFSHSLVTEGGGRYRPEEDPFEHTLEALSQACKDQAGAESRVIEQLGQAAARLVSRDEVIIPMADALLHAKSSDSRGAVLRAGNAIDSYLDGLATRKGVALGSASGINAKLDKLQRDGGFPKKLVFVGKYVGHIRNAADHGVDPDTGSSWEIRKATGLESIYVSCSFIAAATLWEEGGGSQI
jgi:hypothetical protein